MKKEKREQLRERVSAIKPTLILLPGWKGRFLKQFPEYDDVYGITLISNVMAERSADLKLTECLEQFYNENASK